MQVFFTGIKYDSEYIYATGRNTLTGEVRQIKISRTNDKDYWCSGVIEFDRIFYAGAIELYCILEEKGKLPKTKCFTWT
jgi:hypothetical protein